MNRLVDIDTIHSEIDAVIRKVFELEPDIDDRAVLNRVMFVCRGFANPDWIAKRIPELRS